MRNFLQFLYISFFVLISNWCFCQYQWYPYEEDGKIGWKTENGKGSFPPGTVAEINFPVVITQQRKYGLIDSTGKLLIDTAFLFLSDFNNDRGIAEHADVKSGFFMVATASLPNSGYQKKFTNYGIVDRSGKYILPPEYTDITKASDSMLIVSGQKNGASHRALFSLKKKQIVSGDFQRIDVLPLNNLFLTQPITAPEERFKLNPNHSLMDESGKVILNFRNSKHAWAYEFWRPLERIYYSTGVLLLLSDDYEYLFSDGKIIDSSRIEWRDNPADGSRNFHSLLRSNRFPNDPLLSDENRYSFKKIQQIETDNANYLFDDLGNLVLSSGLYRFHMYDEYYGNYQFYIVDSTGKVGIIDNSGAIILPAILDGPVSYITGAVYAGKIDGRNTWFSRKNEEKQFTQLFHDSLEAFSSLPESYSANRVMNEKGYVFLRSRASGKMGIGDLLGNIIVAPDYESILAVEDGYIIKNPEGAAIIDSNLNILLQTKYDKMVPIGKHYTVTKGKLNGVIDKSGKILVPVKFDYIESDGRNYFQFELDGKKGVAGYGKIIRKPGDERYEWIIYDTILAIYRSKKVRLLNLRSNRYLTPWLGRDSLQEIERTFSDMLHTDGTSSCIELVYRKSRQIIDQNGKEISPLYSKRSGNYLVGFGRKKPFTLLNVQGKKMLEGEYDRIIENGFYGDLFLLQRDYDTLFGNGSSGKIFPTDCRWIILQTKYRDSSYVLGENSNQKVFLYGSSGQKLFDRSFEKYRNGDLYQYSDTALYLRSENKDFRFSMVTRELYELPYMYAKQDAEAELKKQRYEALQKKYVEVERPKISGEWTRYGAGWKGSDGDKIYWITQHNVVYHITYFKAKK